MKMQVAFLPGGKFALVLSGADMAAAEGLAGLREDIGAAAVLVFEDDVELEGFVSSGPDEPEPAQALPKWTSRPQGPLDWTQTLLRNAQSEG